MVGSGTCGGWWPASGWPAGRTVPPRTDCEAAVLQCVAAYRDRGAGALAERRCSPAPTNGSTSTACSETDHRRIVARRDRPARSSRARTRTSDRALPRFTREHEGQRRIVEEPPLITRVSDADADMLAVALDDYLDHAGAALAPGAGRLHARRHRAQGRRGRQRRPARLCRAARGQQSGRRGVPAAQAGPAVGAGQVRARRHRPGTPTRASGWSSTSRRCRRSAIRCSAGQPPTGGSTTCGSSGT